MQAPKRRGGVEFWSIADQAIVSAASFAAQLIIARGQPEREYGFYALAYGALLIANSVNASLVTYPLLIHGAGLDSVKLWKLASESLASTALLGSIAGLVTFCTFYALGSPAIGLCAAAALLAWQLQETLRRTMMAGLAHRTVLGIDLFFYGGYAISILVEFKLGALTVGRVFAIQATFAILSVALQLRVVRLSKVDAAAAFRRIRRFWPEAKWITLSNAAAALATQGFAWALVSTGSAADVAAFQASANIANAGNPITLGVGNVLVPQVVRAHARGDSDGTLRSAIQLSLKGGIILVAYYLSLFVWPRAFLALAYGQSSPYCAFTGAMRFLAVAQLINYPSQTAGAFLNCVGKSRGAFVAQLAGAASVFVLGWPLVVYRGVGGAALGLTFSNTVRCSVAIAQLLRGLNTETAFAAEVGV